MSRSINVSQKYIEKVNSQFHYRFSSQKALAEELGISRSTVQKFLNGKPVDYSYFLELSQKLDFEWESIVEREENSGFENDFSSNFYYILRPPIEEICYEEIQQSNTLLRIRSPQKMGKTYLIAKIIRRAKYHNFRAIYLNLKEVDESCCNNFGLFLYWFCKQIELKLYHFKDSSDDKKNIIKFATSERIDNSQCKQYFEHLLSLSRAPLVLGLDGLDYIFSFPIANDFLRLLRGFHEEAKSYDIWKNFRVIIAYSTESYIPLDIRHSPFNVGKYIELPEFTLNQVKQLLKLHAIYWQPSRIERLMDFIGGHPYLIQLAIDKIKILQHKFISIENFLIGSTEPGGIYYTHLDTLLEYIQNDSQLEDIMKLIIEESSKPVQLDLKKALFKLYSLGLVKLKENSGDKWIIRCKLYQQYFKEHLGRDI